MLLQVELPVAIIFNIRITHDSIVFEEWCCKTESGIESLNDIKALECRHHIAELEVVLKKEKREFEESLQNTLHEKAQDGRTTMNILKVNRLQRRLVFYSYTWDQRLTCATSLGSNIIQVGLSGSTWELKRVLEDSDGGLSKPMWVIQLSWAENKLSLVRDWYAENAKDSILSGDRSSGP